MGDTRSDFYWKLDTVSRRVQNFVELLGSKYELKFISRRNGSMDNINSSNFCTI